MPLRPNIYASGIPRIRRGPQRSSQEGLTQNTLADVHPQVATVSDTGTESLDSGSLPGSSIYPEDSAVGTVDGSEYASLSEEINAASPPQSGLEHHLGPTFTHNIHSSPAQHQFGFSGFGNTRPNPVAGAPTSASAVTHHVTETTEDLVLYRSTTAAQLAGSSPRSHLPEDTSQSSTFDGRTERRPQTGRTPLRRTDSHQAHEASLRGGDIEQRGEQRGQFQESEESEPGPILHLSGRFVNDPGPNSPPYTFRESILVPSRSRRERRPDTRPAQDVAAPYPTVGRNRGSTRAPTDSSGQGNIFFSRSRELQRSLLVPSLAQAQYDGQSEFSRPRFADSRRPVGPSRGSSYSSPNLLSSAAFLSPPPISPYMQGRSSSTGSNRLVVPSDFDASYRNPVNAARLNLSSPLDLIHSRGNAEMNRSSSGTSVSYQSASSQPRFNSASFGRYGHMNSPRPAAPSPPVRTPFGQPSSTGSRHSNFGSIRRSRIPSPLPFATSATIRDPRVDARSRSNGRSSAGTAPLSATSTRAPVPDHLALPGPPRIPQNTFEQFQMSVAARTHTRSSENTGPAASPRLIRRSDRDISPNGQRGHLTNTWLHSLPVAAAAPRPQSHLPQHPSAATSLRSSSARYNSQTAMPPHSPRFPRSPRSSESEAYMPPSPMHNTLQFPPLAVPRGAVPPPPQPTYPTMPNPRPHISRIPTPQPSHSHQPQRRRNAISNGSDERPRTNAITTSTNNASRPSHTRGSRLPSWQQEQENSGEAEEALMLEELRAREMRGGSGSTDGRLDVLDETPPRLGRFERRMMGL